MSPCIDDEAVKKAYNYFIGEGAVVVDNIDDALSIVETIEGELPQKHSKTTIDHFP
jgi:hypothetical protein